MYSLWAIESNKHWQYQYEVVLADYCKAAFDKLEHIVVQQLFELFKLGLLGTGGLYINLSFLYD